MPGLGKGKSPMYLKHGAETLSWFLIRLLPLAVGMGGVPLFALEDIADVRSQAEKRSLAPDTPVTVNEGIVKLRARAEKGDNCQREGDTQR
jgi:hypothetical protein